MRAVCPLRRDGRRRRRRAARLRPLRRPRGAQPPPARRRRPQRARLRAVGPRGQAQRPIAGIARRLAAAPARRHRLHPELARARRDGRGRARVPHLPLLKLKLGGAGDAERMAAVRAARPDARLVVDANEAWTPELLEPLLAAAAAAGVELIEQPLPAGADDALAEIGHPVPICADESAHTGRPARACRPLRRGQHQARQGGRPHRGAGDGATPPAPTACASWSAAWWPPRSPPRRPCSSPASPTGSTSTGRCCWRGTATRPSPSAMAGISPPPRAGG